MGRLAQPGKPDSWEQAKVRQRMLNRFGGRGRVVKQIAASSRNDRRQAVKKAIGVVPRLKTVFVRVGGRLRRKLVPWREVVLRHWRAGASKAGLKGAGW